MIYLRVTFFKLKNIIFFKLATLQNWKMFPYRNICNNFFFLHDVEKFELYIYGLQ